ncbi:hypothetical protein HDU98_010642 [Podochytrium sp. JEL0797]|nr:hypothetical protein HDU98_010642 [Podochytrium sp. JEL0797]
MASQAIADLASFPLGLGKEKERCLLSFWSLIDLTTPTDEDKRHLAAIAANDAEHPYVRGFAECLAGRIYMRSPRPKPEKGKAYFLRSKGWFESLQTSTEVVSDKNGNPHPIRFPSKLMIQECNKLLETPTLLSACRRFNWKSLSTDQIS